MYTTIKTLYEKKISQNQIAKMTGHDRKTIRKIIREIQKGHSVPQCKSYSRQLDAYKEQIIRWIEEGLTAVRIHEELCKIGSTSAYPTVKRYVGEIKKRENIFMRIHTKPGEEAQVDFGYAGYTPDDQGKRRKTWVFNMRLSYSRLDYYEAVYDQKVETFIECHKNAFAYFGGIPHTVKIDNLKAAILEANFYEPIFQTMYKNFAEHYGFKPMPCRVYTPNDKGKVESGIKYVKTNFFSGRTFSSKEDLDKRLQKWMEKVNQRTHGTTKKVPCEMFRQEEAALMITLPLEEFKLSKVGIRKVYHDCHIYVNHNYYSVPFEYVGKEVDIEVGADLLKVYFNLKEIAVHPLQKGRGNFVTDESHYPKYKRISETELQEKYQKKMAEIGSFAEQLFFILLIEQKGYWLQTVKGILSLEKRYSKEILELSCKRAMAFHVWGYQTIKNICKNGSYKLPVEFNEERYEYDQKQIARV